MTVEYALVSSTTIEELVKDVNKALAEGWKAQGGVSMCLLQGTAEILTLTSSNELKMPLFLQAIIKEST